MADVGKLMVQLGVDAKGFSAGLKTARGQFVTFTEEVRDAMGVVTTVTKKQFIAQKNAAEEWGKALKRTGEEIGQIGQGLTRALSLPVGGLAAAALASSERATRIFKSFASDVRMTMGQLGDTLVEDLHLDEALKSISSFVDDAVKAFERLPAPMRKFVEILGSMAIIVGPALIALGNLVRMGGYIALAFGKAAAAMKSIGMLGAAAGAGAAAGVTAAAAAVATAGFMAGNYLADFSAPVANRVLGVPTSEHEKATTAGAVGIARATETLGEDKILSGYADQLEAALQKFASAKKLTEYGIEELGRHEAALNEWLKMGGERPIQKISGESAEDRARRLIDTIGQAQKEFRNLQDLASQKDIWGPIEIRAKRAFDGVDLAIKYSEKTLDDYASAGEEKIKILTAALIKMEQDGVDPNNEKIKELKEQLEDLRGETFEIKIQMEVENIQKDIQNAFGDWQAGGGGNPIAEARSRLIQGRQDLLAGGVPESSTAIQDMTADIEKLSGAWATFMGQLANTPTILQQIGSMMFSIYQTFTTGVGDALAQFLVYGANAGKVFTALGKQITAMIVSMTTTMIVQYAIMKLLGVQSYMQQMAAGLKSAAALTFANTFAAVCAIPIVGPFLAAGKAAAATAIMLAGAAGAAAIGGAIGTGLGASAEGGIFTRPGVTRIAERGRPEIVLNEANIQRYFPMLAGGGGRPIYLEVPVFMDGYEVARVSAKKMPDVHRDYGTGWGV